MNLVFFYILCVISILISLQKSDNFPEFMAKKRSRGQPTRRPCVLMQKSFATPCKILGQIPQ